MSYSPDTLHLLVEGEPYLSACAEWRQRYMTATKAGWAYAQSLGAGGFFPNFDQELVALMPVEPLPPGWTRLTKRRVNELPRMMPIKGPAGDMAREQIAALPRMPKWGEIATLIGHPCQIRWKSENGCGFNTLGVGHWRLVDIAWTPEHFMILACDPAPSIARLRISHPGVEIQEGEWTPPAGLTPITKARWDLYEAQARFDDEVARQATGTPV